jgi:hypothetical protein
LAFIKKSQIIWEEISPYLQNDIKKSLIQQKTVASFPATGICCYLWLCRSSRQVIAVAPAPQEVEAEQTATSGDQPRKSSTDNRTRNLTNTNPQ